MALTLGPLDTAVVLVFVAALLALGFSARLRDHSVLQFLAAGRGLTLPVFVATLVSTWYGGILGIGESVSYYGLGTWVLLGVPYYVFALLYATKFAERVREADQISLPERLGQRFGNTAALVGGALVFLLAVPSFHVLMLGTLVQAFTGWSFGVAVVVGAGVGTLFLYRGGLLADARASLLAFAMMYVGFAVMAVYCLVRYPLGKTLGSLEPHLLTWDGGTGVPYVLSFLILGAWTLVDPGFHQRVASAATPRIGRRGVFISVGFWFVFDAMSIVSAMYALALLKPVPENRLMVFPALGEAVLPPGLKAMFVCGMVGTIVSAMVGYTLVGGSSLGRDLVARAKGGLDDAQVKAWTRFGIGVATVVAIVLASQIQSVVQLWYMWGGAIVGALLLPVASSYGLLPLRAGNRWVVGSMAGAFALSFALLVYGIRTQNPFLDVQVGETSFNLGTLLPGLALSALVLGVGEWLARRPEHA
ncbi:MAG: hypothetical protein M9921_07530 [Fimbriimonadaceae bacterium]|nr:hypothetical protein [Chthonomonadaceae bacterium]MCO5296692.1 hypothetical protein [Fimbriimonadaceae bacterium]